MCVHISDFWTFKFALFHLQGILKENLWIIEICFFPLSDAILILFRKWTSKYHIESFLYPNCFWWVKRWYLSKLYIYNFFLAQAHYKTSLLYWIDLCSPFQFDSPNESVLLNKTHWLARIALCIYIYFIKNFILSSMKLTVLSVPVLKYSISSNARIKWIFVAGNHTKPKLHYSKI